MTAPVARQQGFTLIEVLVYLALAASILAALAGGTFVVRRSAQAVVASSERLEMLDLGLQAFADDIARIERMTTGSPDAPHYLFSGGRDQVTYVLADRPRPAASTLMLVRLTVRQDPQGAALVRERAAFDATSGQPLEPWGDATTLFSGPYRIAFAYRGTVGGHDGEWLDQWTNPRRLPGQVRLTIIDRLSGKTAVPSLAVALLIGAEPVCADPATAGCTLPTAGELAWRAQ